MKMLEKLLKRLQEGKKDNKGFSLVELIIVIAIMAILIGIVGMNVLPQIENARKATDAQVISAMVSEAMEAYTQVMNASGSVDITVGVAGDGTLSFSAPASPTSNADKCQVKFAELAGFSGSGTPRVLKSTAGKALGGSGGSGIVIHCDETNGVYIGTTDGYLTGFDGYEFRSR